MTLNVGKLKPEIKAAWVAALRSGEYQQSKEGYLNKDGSYCCLGVLCELAVEAGIIQRFDVAGMATVSYGTGLDSDNTMPSDDVAEWAYETLPVEGSGRWYLPEGSTPLAHQDDAEAVGLARINDDTPADFALIADLIEFHL